MLLVDHDYADFGKYEAVDTVHYPVYTNNMVNITLSANEESIAKARRLANSRNTSLNVMFREWLDHLSSTNDTESVSKRLNALWEKTTYKSDGRKLTREEMNER